jgi:hypothetical protein
MPVKSVIAWPGDRTNLQQGTHSVFGFAWSGFGEITGVEVSVDDQRTWAPARVVRGDGPLAWARWEYTWRPVANGPATLATRASDSAGNVQPKTVAWNKFGYQMNAIHTRTVSVQD